VISVVLENRKRRKEAIVPSHKMEELDELAYYMGLIDVNIKGFQFCSGLAWTAIFCLKLIEY